MALGWGFQGKTEEAEAGSFIAMIGTGL